MANPASKDMFKRIPSMDKSLNRPGVQAGSGTGILSAGGIIG